MQAHDIVAATQSPSVSPNVEAQLETLVRKMQHKLRRLLVSNDALLTLTEAAEILDGRAVVNRDWIRSYVQPVRSPNGRELYLWGDILDRLKEETP
jgi:hypothetical protein